MDYVSIGKSQRAKTSVACSYCGNTIGHNSPYKLILEQKGKLRVLRKHSKKCPQKISYRKKIIKRAISFLNPHLNGN